MKKILCLAAAVLSLGVSAAALQRVGIYGYRIGDGELHTGQTEVSRYFSPSVTQIVYGPDHQMYRGADDSKATFSLVNNGMKVVDWRVAYDYDHVNTNSFNVIQEGGNAFTWEIDEGGDWAYILVTLDYKKFNLAYDLCGGSGDFSDRSMIYDAVFELSTGVPTREGYEFAGWTNAVNSLFSPGETVSGLTLGVPEGGDGAKVTLYARWKQLDALGNGEYVVYFDPGIAVGEMSAVTAQVDTAFYLPINGFSRGEMFDFDGWVASDGKKYSDRATVSNLAPAGYSTVLTAQWKERVYTVKYSMALGCTNVEWRTEDKTGGVTWSADGTNAVVRMGKDVATSGNSPLLYAKCLTEGTLSFDWMVSRSLSRREFYLEYDLRGGMGVFDRVGPKFYEEAFELSTAYPVRDGYDFAGWTNAVNSLFWPGETVSGPTIGAAGSGDVVVLYARWTPRASSGASVVGEDEYVVHFNPSNAVGQMASVTARVDTAFNLPICGFSRVGWEFNGWSKSANATTATYTDGQSVSNLAPGGSNIVLTAQWVAQQFYTNKYSTALECTNVEWCVGEKTGSSQWTEDGTNAVVSMDKGSVGQQSPYLYAKCPAEGVLKFEWKVSRRREFYLEYDLCGGVGTFDRVGPKSCEETFVLPTDEPVRTGYVFAGWTNAVNSLFWPGETVSAPTLGVSDVGSGETLKVTLYARWEVAGGPAVANDEYVVYFDPGVALGQMEPVTAKVNTAFYLPLNEFSRPRWEFVRWQVPNGSTYANGENVVNLAPVGSNVVLTAQWSEKVYGTNEYAVALGCTNIEWTVGSLGTFKDLVVDGGTNVMANFKAQNKCSTRKLIAKCPVKGMLGFEWMADGDGDDWIGTSEVKFEIDNNVLVKTNEIISADNRGKWNRYECDVTAEGNFYVYLAYNNKSPGLYDNAFFRVRNASWVSKDYVWGVKFDANGGSGIMAPCCASAGSNIDLTENSFMRKGYEFLGWSKDKDAFAPDFYDMAQISQLEVGAPNWDYATLYAVWKKTCATITITGVCVTNVCDGMMYSVPEPCFTAVSDKEDYSVSNVVYVGTAKVKDKRHPGVYKIPLSAADFINKNVDWNGRVEFKIALDGELCELCITGDDVPIAQVGGCKGNKVQFGSAVEDVDFTEDALGKWTNCEIRVSGSANAGVRLYFGSSDCEQVELRVRKATWESTVNAETAIWGVEFDANDGEGFVPCCWAYSGSMIDLPANLFTRTGHRFRGWAKARDAVNPDFASREQVGQSDVGATDGECATLYAVWEKTYVTVTITGNCVTNVCDGAKHNMAEPRFTVVSDDDSYSVDDVMYVGTAKVQDKRHPGVYKAGLVPGDFINKNVEWKDKVQFVVSDGELCIEGSDVPVELSGGCDGNKVEFTPNAVPDTEEVEFTEDLLGKWTNCEIQVSGPTNAGIRMYFGNADCEQAVLRVRNAKWTSSKSVWGVKFDANGGRGVMPSRYEFSGSSLVLPANAFIKDDRMFCGWAKKKDAVEPDFASRDQIAQMDAGAANWGCATLYAVWKKYDVNVTITGMTKSVEYDGDKHSVADNEYFTVTSDNPQYSKDSIKFIGGARVKDKIYKGEYKMLLTAHDFENVNANWNGRVLIKVMDGELKITDNGGDDNPGGGDSGDDDPGGGGDVENSIEVGSAVTWSIPVPEGARVRVSKLPTGLKYKDGVVTGVPTKAGTYRVKVKTKIGRDTSVEEFDVTVAALPEYLPGKYHGFATNAGGINGLVSLKLTTKAKLSGYIYNGYEKMTVSGKGFAGRTADGSYLMDVTCKKGSFKFAATLVFSKTVSGGREYWAVSLDSAERVFTYVEAYRDMIADVLGGVPAEHVGTTPDYWPGMKLKVAKSGAVSVSGKMPLPSGALVSVSCKPRLVLLADGTLWCRVAVCKKPRGADMVVFDEELEF